ncbi:putative phage protein [Listeria weihenstephanensis FSL R9-0317]|nr:HeH/LEM domain-containing protein [Listeria weihenstephanensis]EUJ41523.1 putative phage protein [Listeria weihenstephanensis FSL R9-0317]
MTNSELKAILDEREIPYAVKATKAELIALIEGAENDGV